MMTCARLYTGTSTILPSRLTEAVPRRTPSSNASTTRRAYSTLAGSGVNTRFSTVTWSDGCIPPLRSRADGRWAASCDLLGRQEPARRLDGQRQAHVAGRESARELEAEDDGVGAPRVGLLHEARNVDGEDQRRATGARSGHGQMTPFCASAA